MNHTILKRLAAILAAVTLLATAASCESNEGAGKDTTTKEGTTTVEKEDNVWESFLEELEGSETLFQRDEHGDIHLPDIPISPSD